MHTLAEKGPLGLELFAIVVRRGGDTDRRFGETRVLTNFIECIL
uniref:Transcriptional regulator n=1 Tax=Heterorhabditis bacteriophora TaxID=37862 RepID=A0A1I7WSK1_HETBA